MDSSLTDVLVKRLVANPHDEQALAYAHRQGEDDPAGYAQLLELVGAQTSDPSYASHWLSEAGNVWAKSVGDLHRAARVFMSAIEKDPTQALAADRLSELYRERGDLKGLAALLDRRARAMASRLPVEPGLRGDVGALFEELGRLYSDPQAANPKKAAEAYRRAIEVDPTNALAIYTLRELLKQQGAWAEVFELYRAELAVEGDPARRVALLRDEAATRRQQGDPKGATRALGLARQIDDSDPALQQEYAASVLDRMAQGERVDTSERSHAAELLVGLAEVYDGAHGVAYASGALDLEPGHDRALQLLAYHARPLQRDEEILPRYQAYLAASPRGAMADEARRHLGSDAPAEIEASRGSDPDDAPYLPTTLASAAEPSKANGGAPRDRAALLEEPTSRGGPMVSLSDIEETDLQSEFLQAPPAEPERPNRGTQKAAAERALGRAQALSTEGNHAEALQAYREVLAADPTHPEALAWVEDYLRSSREYGQLREILLASVRALGDGGESAIAGRKARLREIAGLSEVNLRDLDGAVNAWRQLLALDRTDDAARQSLRRLLEKAERWDDLAVVLEQQATAEPDIELKIAAEKKLADLHETKRKDLAAAGEVWGRIAEWSSGDADAVVRAADLLERGGDPVRAEEVLAEHTASVSDPAARAGLLERIGALRLQAGNRIGAGSAYADAAALARDTRLWEAAETAFHEGGAWRRSADAAKERAALENDPKSKAMHLARAGQAFVQAGDEAEALSFLEQAVSLDPENDPLASELCARYAAVERYADQAALLVKRADGSQDASNRAALRSEAAAIFASALKDRDAARTEWRKVLDDGDDREALEQLIADAIEQGEPREALPLFRRLQALATGTPDAVQLALREAELLAEGLDDVEGAVARYETIVRDIDPTCRAALQAIADLQEARDRLPEAADALERELQLVTDPAERATLGARLARAYDHLSDSPRAIAALEVVRAADPDDFDALARLSELFEETSQWDRAVGLLGERIEIEADDEELSLLTRKQAQILADRLERGDDALATLTPLAEAGDPAMREAFVALGDRLGKGAEVASRLVGWFRDVADSDERTLALRGAFERYAAAGRGPEAIAVADDVVEAGGGDESLAVRLEALAVDAQDGPALGLAHELLEQLRAEESGEHRASELVRQAEVRVHAGFDPNEALAHGESGLSLVPAAEAEPLLARLAEIAEGPAARIALYERHVARCRVPSDRLQALARAAQVAVSVGEAARAQALFDQALSGTPSDETIAVLERAASEGDEGADAKSLQRALATALAAGGRAVRDGGRTRGTLLRRAAALAEGALGDPETAFTWLSDALVSHVEPSTLDALERLGARTSAPARTEAALTRAIDETSDSTLLRQLYARRAKVRRDALGSAAAAASDLKKLHELAHNDASVLEDLTRLLTDLQDYRGLVQVYEDQVLRGKDMAARAEIARAVARLWEEKLRDARESADAWRRVLRMKPGDAEAVAGLERAKSNILKGTVPPPPMPAGDSADLAPGSQVLRQSLRPGILDLLDEPRAREPLSERPEAATERPPPPDATTLGYDEPPAPPPTFPARFGELGATPITNAAVIQGASLPSEEAHLRASEQPLDPARVAVEARASAAEVEGETPEIRDLRMALEALDVDLPLFPGGAGGFGGPSEGAPGYADRESHIEPLGTTPQEPHDGPPPGSARARLYDTGDLGGSSGSGHQEESTSRGGPISSGAQRAIGASSASLAAPVPSSSQVVARETVVDEEESHRLAAQTIPPGREPLAPRAAADEAGEDVSLDEMDAPESVVELADDDLELDEHEGESGPVRSAPPPIRRS